MSDVEEYDTREVGADEDQEENEAEDVESSPRPSHKKPRQHDEEEEEEEDDDDEEQEDDDDDEEDEEDNEDEGMKRGKKRRKVGSQLVQAQAALTFHAIRRSPG